MGGAVLGWRVHGGRHVFGLRRRMGGVFIQLYEEVVPAIVYGSLVEAILLIQFVF
jgi:hypothetical protein